MQVRGDHARRHRALRGLGALAATGIVVATVAAPAGAATTAYTMTDLATVAGGTFQPTGFAAGGQVVGTISTTGAGALYDPATGTVTDLGTVAAGTFTPRGGSNLAGQIPGSVPTPIATTGFNAATSAFVRNGDGTGTRFDPVVVDPAKAAATSVMTSAQAVNDSGQVLANTRIYSTTLTATTASVGTVGSPALSPLGSLNGGNPATLADDTFGYDLNNKGQVVGTALVDALANYHAFVSGPSGLVDLNVATHTPATLNTTACARAEARAINDSGMAVGSYSYSWTAGGRGSTCGVLDRHAAVWNTATNTFTEMATTTSALLDVNATGDTVGWVGADGVIGNVAAPGLTPLTGLVTALPTGWTITQAAKIADSGAILATAKDASATLHAVLLRPSGSTPPPPPSAPAAPTGLVAARGSTLGNVQLRWTDNATNETGFTIERCAGRGCTAFTVLATVGGNVVSYADTTPKVAGTRYSYRVKAVNAGGSSAYSNVLTVSYLR